MTRAPLDPCSAAAPALPSRGDGAASGEVVTSRGCLGLVFLAACFAVLACVVAGGCWVWAAIQR